jgi:hypothetical protein
MSALEIDGIKNVRKGAIWLLIAPIVLIISEFVMTIIAVSLIGPSIASTPLSITSFSGVASIASASAALFFALIFIAFIIADFLFLLSFGSFRTGFKELPNMTLGSIGGLVGKIGALIQIVAFVAATALLVIVYLTLSSGGTLSSVTGLINFASISIIIGEAIGGLLTAIALILVGIGIYSLGSRYNEGLLKVGGILIATLVISLIGVILSIIGAGSVKNKLQSGQLQPISQMYTQPAYAQPQYQPYPQQPSQPSQSQGTIYSNGVAVLQVNFYQQGKVLYAVLDDYRLNSINVNPQFLSPGVNNITVYFPPLQLIQGKMYRIVLFIDVGGTVIQYPVNVVSA